MQGLIRMIDLEKITKPSKNAPLKCYWKDIALKDYLRSILKNQDILKIENYENWKKCFYCGFPKTCKDYIPKIIR